MHDDVRVQPTLALALAPAPALALALAPAPAPSPSPNPGPGPNQVRAVTDVRVEKDESHPGKVMFRNVYERNKEKFPYSRFEVQP